MIQRVIVFSFSLFFMAFVHAHTKIPNDAIIKHGKTLSSVLEQFQLDPNNEFSDAPYYEDARPTPLETFNSLIPKRVVLYTDLIRCSEGSYLLFGQGNNILQILLAGHKIYALQLNCAMHCDLSEDTDKTYQVIVSQNGKSVKLPNRVPKQRSRKQCYRYGAAMPLKIAVNLGDKAASEKPWQIIRLEFDPIAEEYRLYYWRQEKA